MYTAKMRTNLCRRFFMRARSEVCNGPGRLNCNNGGGGAGGGGAGAGAEAGGGAPPGKRHW